MKKYIKYIIYFMLTLLIGYLIINIVVDIYNARPISFFGYYISNVPTNSMDPIIKPGSYVLIKECDNYGLYDIAVYKNNKGMYIIHQIIEINGDSYILKGVNNIVADEPIGRESFYGKYVCNVDFLTAILGGKNKNVIFLILILLFLIMVIAQIINVYLTYKNKLRNDEINKLKEELKKEILKEELLKDDSL